MHAQSGRLPCVLNARAFRISRRRLSVCEILQNPDKSADSTTLVYGSVFWMMGKGKERNGKERNGTETRVMGRLSLRCFIELGTTLPNVHRFPRPVSCVNVKFYALRKNKKLSFFLQLAQRVIPDTSDISFVLLYR